jgi:hypothetical protein
MDNSLFEQLLYEEESTTLDFKQEQYRFAKATEEEKSELLKDILGFANSWRRSHAFILIGVEDVRGGRSFVRGVSEHLPDHSLQQFVNNLTNQPVQFRYEAFGVEGKQVGVIRIDEQVRPIYLKRDYGKLEKEKVFVRRGSSTDPSKPASLEEIAQMRVGSGNPDAELTLEFADLERDESLGIYFAWDAEFCEMPSMESIPDLVRRSQWHPTLKIELSDMQFDPMNRLNEDFYRELAAYEFARRLFRPVRLFVKNTGQIAAKNVHAELIVPTTIGVMVLGTPEMPDPPKRKADIINQAAMRGSRPAFMRERGEVTIDKNDQRFGIGIDCGDLQPGRWIKSDIFFVGKGQTGDLALAGQVFAENLPHPKEFGLTISVNVNKTTMTLSDLLDFREPGISNDD